MLAVELKTFGGPEVVSITEIPTPKINAEQILIHVRACGLNRADLLQRKGQYAIPPGETDVMGLEVAGDVIEVGKDVKEFKVGDRVFGLVGSGACAEYCVMDGETALPIPKNLNYIEAAGVAEAFMTANEAIFTLGELKGGESILIHAGGSGVGTAGIQLAKFIGAEIYTTVGSEEKAAKLKKLGVDHIINYKTQDFAEIIKTGIDVVIDFIGAKYLAPNMQVLNNKGRLIEVGLMGGRKAEIDLGIVQTKRLQIKGLVMRKQSKEEKRAIAQRFKHKWLPLLAENKIQPIIDSVFPLKEVRAAHERMEANANFGKIIIEMP